MYTNNSESLEHVLLKADLADLYIAWTIRCTRDIEIQTEDYVTLLLRCISVDHDHIEHTVSDINRGTLHWSALLDLVEKNDLVKRRTFNQMTVKTIESLLPE